MITLNSEMVYNNNFIFKPTFFLKLWLHLSSISIKFKCVHTEGVLEYQIQPTAATVSREGSVTADVGGRGGLELEVAVCGLVQARPRPAPCRLGF